jgi:hypothetical protein
MCKIINKIINTFRWIGPYDTALINILCYIVVAGLVWCVGWLTVGVIYVCVMGISR